MGANSDSNIDADISKRIPKPSAQTLAIVKRLHDVRRGAESKGVHLLLVHHWFWYGLYLRAAASDGKSSSHQLFSIRCREAGRKLPGNFHRFDSGEQSLKDYSAEYFKRFDEVCAAQYVNGMNEMIPEARLAYKRSSLLCAACAADDERSKM